MSVTKTRIKFQQEDRGQRKYSILMTADADEIIFDVHNFNEFSLQSINVAADEIEVYFTNQETPTSWVQWVSSLGENPWTKEEIAKGSMDFSFMKIVRNGATDGDHTAELILK